VFVEAPRDEREMERACASTRIPHLANMVEGGDTPLLSHARLEEIGYRLIAYPLTLLSTAARAMEEALGALSKGDAPQGLLRFEALRERVGFDEYDRVRSRYADDAGGGPRQAVPQPRGRQR
jgi:2-methylisocitrate lyase-like PEP mutase family enzyme